VTAITYSITSTHHVITALVVAAVSGGLTVALMLAFSTAKASTTQSRATHADTRLCQLFYNAAPGSPVQFRIGEAIAAQGSC
jgi:hypothetical protein